MICIFCKEEVQESDDKFWVGLDIPYINLITHRACFRENKFRLNEVLQREKELIYKILEEFNGKVKSTSKKSKTI